MSYKVLYRKYRPISFSKIIGQKTIVETLKNSAINSSLSHAYIFTGPRGTGKTSTAKVLAKAINCLNPQDGEACCKCENCLNFQTSLDIIEIDAASNNGVDEIRELRNNITLAPASLKYKVYIIDEVHMLTTGAFNALLKTLEEPPEHAIFILATTEIYKVPITILSRCQRYDFKKISKDDLIEHLKYICTEEKIEYDPEVLEEIYSLSEGCARDALSILDQISKSSTHITMGLMLENYNIISNKTILELLEATTNGVTERIVELLETFEKTGMNAQKLIKKMINYLEKVAIQVKLKEEKRYSFPFLYKLITNLNECYIDARINENVFTMIKLCFLEMIGNDTSEVETQPQKTVIQSEKTVTREKETQSIRKEQPNPTSNLTLTQIRINNCFVDVNKESLKDILAVWNNLDNKKVSSLDIKAYTPIASSKEYTIFTTEENSLADLFNIKREDIEKLLKDNNKQNKVVAITNYDWNKEKEKFKNNRIKKIKYEYIEEPAPVDDGAELKGQLDTLFTEKIVEIS